MGYPKPVCCVDEDLHSLEGASPGKAHQKVKISKEIIDFHGLIHSRRKGYTELPVGYFWKMVNRIFNKAKMECVSGCNSYARS